MLVFAVILISTTGLVSKVSFMMNC